MHNDDKCYQMLTSSASDRKGMDDFQPKRPIDAISLARFMGDVECRAQAAGGMQLGRPEKLQNLLNLLKNLPERDFQSCIDACEAVVERFAQSGPRRESHKKSQDQVRKEAAKLVG